MKVNLKQPSYINPKEETSVDIVIPITSSAARNSDIQIHDILFEIWIEAQVGRVARSSARRSGSRPAPGK